MKAFIVLTTILILKVCADEKYTTKFDNIDLEEIVKSERLLKGYVNCLLDKGACTPDGLELKKVMPDAILSECSKCSKKQRDGSDFILKHLIDNKPDLWKPLREKYDPDEVYTKKHFEEKKKEEESKTESKENGEK